MKLISFGALMNIDFNILKGLELKKVKTGDDFVEFYVKDGRIFRLCHIQQCCEDVYLDKIIGDIKDIVKTPIIDAYVSCSDKNPKNKDDSFTWTFYRILTVLGTVVFKFYGSSNGYYSEDVDFIEKGREKDEN